MCVRESTDENYFIGVVVPPKRLKTLHLWSSVTLSFGHFVQPTNYFGKLLFIIYSIDLI